MNLRQSVLWCFAVPLGLLVCGGWSLAVAQAQDTVEPRDVRVSIGAAGINRFHRDRWSIVGIRASNHGAAATESVLSVYLEEDSRTQFSRRFWLPAGATRFTWLPILPAENIPADRTVLHVSSMQLEGSAGAELLSHVAGEQLIQESIFSLDQSAMQMATIFGRPRPGTQMSDNDLGDASDDEAYETIIAVRQLYGEDRRTSTLSDQFQPPYPEAYDSLDQLVICSDRLADDSGGLAAIRNWLARGGRVWVMLDLVGLDAARALCGNALNCEVIDRRELTEFTLHTPDAAARDMPVDDHWSAEDPVDFLRVRVESAAIHADIDGWPAAFSFPFGNGQVLITTLGARGWRYQYDEFAEPPPESTQPTSGPTNSLQIIAGIFNHRRDRNGLPAEVVKEVLSEQLGHRVPARSLAAVILLANCGVLLGAGVWFARRQQWEHIAWVVPVLAGVSAGLLVIIGWANTSRVSATAAIFRLVDVASETNEAHSRTWAAFYSPESVELPLEIDRSGSVLPELQDLTGVAKQAVWDDDGRCRWERVGVTSGAVRFASADESGSLDQSIHARAQFGPRGLTGTLEGVEQLGDRADAVVAWPPGPNSAVQLTPQGEFVVGEGQILAPSEYLTGTLLSDEQQRRQSIYRQLLGADDGKTYPQRATLFVWSHPRSFGLTIPPPFEPAGATLYAIPLDIARTPEKGAFVVPAAFIRMENAGLGHGSSSMYNPRTGKWMPDVEAPTDSFFRFILPVEVRPCQIHRAEITLKVHAPSRTVTLTGWSQGQQVPLETRESPSGILSFVIDQPDLVQVDDQGGLLFGVIVSPTIKQVEAIADRDRPRDGVSTKPLDTFENATWQIDYLRLQATGEMR